MLLVEVRTSVDVDDSSTLVSVVVEDVVSAGIVVEDVVSAGVVVIVLVTARKGSVGGSIGQNSAIANATKTVCKCPRTGWESCKSR